MQCYNAEDKDQAQYQHNNRVDLKPGALVRVQTQHGAAGAAGTCRPCAVGPRIGNLLLLVGGRTAADGGPRTTGRRGCRKPG